MESCWRSGLLIAALKVDRAAGRLLLSLALAVFLLDYGPLVCAQSMHIKTRDERARSENWFLRGRLIPAESAAQLRFSAHKQKIQMRAEQAHAAHLTGISASPFSSSGWTSLGPAPLASDASGIGQQDYNWVSGRVTAIAVDPADRTGNTVIPAELTVEFGSRRTPPTRILQMSVGSR